MALAASLTLVPAALKADTASDRFREARSLYDKGMYERARVLFEQGGEDPLCRCYAVLCAVKLGEPNCEQLVATVDTLYPKSVLSSQIHYEMALRLFERGDFEGCSAEFDKAGDVPLAGDKKAEVLVKRGFCEMEMGRYANARDYFAKAASMPGAYSAAACFELAHACYVDEAFDEAFRWFSKCENSAQFKNLAQFYEIECKFMLKDYRYVVAAGEQLYPEMSPERQVRLSRIMSESYLVLGNASKAQEYLQKEDMAGVKTDADYFHAASVLYAMGDYKGAISYFSRMSEKRDSISQVAAYQLAYSYIQTKNKVSALESFKNAASLKYDPAIREDAYFNYAKLSYDLNKDKTVFDSYINTFPGNKKVDKINGYIAMTCLAEQDYAGAVQAYDKIENLDADQKVKYGRANYLRAAQLMKDGPNRDAIPYLKAAGRYTARTDRFNQLSRYWLAESYYKAGNYKDALSIYTDLQNMTALTNTTEGLLLPYDIAYCYYKQDNFKTAAIWMDKYISTNSQVFRKDALLLRADCDYAMKNYSSAINTYQSVVKEFSDPNDIYPYLHLGTAYGLLGDNANKVKALKRVEQASPSADRYSEAMYELGRAYMDTGDGVNALRIFGKLRTTTTDSTYVSRALMGMGMVYRNQSQYEAALKYYKQVVAMNDSYSDDALQAVQIIYQSMESPEEYLKYVEENNLNAGKSEEEKELLYFNTGEQLFLSGNYSSAVTYLESYLSRYPKGTKRADTYYYLAEISRSTGNREKACDLYKKSVSISSKGTFAEPAMMGYANTSYNLERYSDAYDMYAKVNSSSKVKTNEENAAVGMMRSAFYGKDYASAIAAADKVAAYGGESTRLREALYIKAKSLMFTSERSKALEIFTRLSKEASTPEGAEAYFIIIQSRFDWGSFDNVEKGVYDFASRCGDQTYWLAKSYLVLGDAFLERGNKAQARATYESIRDGYTPSGDADDIPALVEARLEHLNSLNAE